MLKNVFTGMVAMASWSSKDSAECVYEELSLGEKRCLPDESVAAGIQRNPILTVVRPPDRLNSKWNNRMVCLIILKATVISSQAIIVFPVLEPFGHPISSVYRHPDPQTANKCWQYHGSMIRSKPLPNLCALNRFFTGW